MSQYFPETRKGVAFFKVKFLPNNNSGIFDQFRFFLLKSAQYLFTYLSQAKLNVVADPPQWSPAQLSLRERRAATLGTRSS